MTQKEMVLRHLETFGSITSMEAFNDYGITRLSDVIFRLRNEGVKIDSVNETRNNRFDVPTTFSRYTLVKEPVQMELSL